MITRFNCIKLFAICSILTAITNFPSAFTNSSVNTAVHEVRSFLNVSFQYRGWDLSNQTQDFVHGTILNVWFLAQIIGSLIAPYFTDKLGRKAGYLLSSAVMTIGSILQFLSIIFWCPELLMLGRFIAALCSPMSDAVLILYLQEVSPVQLRGTFSFLGEIGYCFMCVIGMLLGMKSVLGDSLKRLLGVSILPGIASLIFLAFIPETPKYLMITKRNRPKALKSLNYFQGKKTENNRILDDFMRESTLDDHTKRSSLKEILTTFHLRFAVLLACAVLVLTLPFYPVLTYSKSMFEYISIDSELAEFASTGLLVAFTLACLFGSLFIDKHPRRFLVLSSGISATFFLALFVVFSMLANLHPKIKFLAMASLFLYAITFGAVLGPLSWFIAPELVTQRHRATLFCLCYGINNILIAITNFSVTSLYYTTGPIIIVPMLVVPSIICIVVIYMWLPETLNKETHEIVREIRCIKKNKHVNDIEDSSSSGSSEDAEDNDEDQKNAMI